MSQKLQSQYFILWKKIKLKILESIEYKYCTEIQSILIAFIISKQDWYETNVFAMLGRLEPTKKSLDSPWIFIAVETLLNMLTMMTMIFVMKFFTTMSMKFFVAPMPRIFFKQSNWDIPSILIMCYWYKFFRLPS